MIPVAHHAGEELLAMTLATAGGVLVSGVLLSVRGHLARLRRRLGGHR